MNQQRQRLTGLDGIRALAVIAVLIFHANHDWLPGGYLGVEVFFVLSGFLITYLLISEFERNGQINLASFADRRLRRLVPALVVTVLLVVGYQVFTRHIALGQTREDLVGVLTYTANLKQIWEGQGYGAAQAFAPFRHFWSLAVEAQFYLLWPFVMIVILTKCSGSTKRYKRSAVGLAATAGLCAAATAFIFGPEPVNAALGCTEDAKAPGFVMFANRCISINDALYLGTFPRIGALIIGAALAFLIKSQRSGAKTRMATLIGWFSLIALAVLCWIMWLQRDGETFIGFEYNHNLFQGGFLLVGILSVGMTVAALNSETTLSRLLEWPVLAWLGSRSYGIYLFHWPIYQVIRQQAGSALSPVGFVGALAATLALSEASYRLVETPIRKSGWLGVVPPTRNGKTTKTVRAVAGVAAGACCIALAVPVVGASNDCSTPTECATRSQSTEDENAEEPTTPDVSMSATPTASISTTSTAQPSSTPSTSPSGSTEATPARSEDETASNDAPPAIVGTPHAVGESVMEEAAPFMRKSGIVTTAGVSWTQKKMFPIVKRYVQSGKMGNVLVIQVGTNSMVTDKTFDKFVEMVPESTTIYLLTVRTPHKVIPKNNKVIRNQPNRHPNIRVIDWHTESTKTKLCRDQTHISCGGGSTKFYANMVNKAIGLPEIPDKPKPTKTATNKPTATATATD